MEENPVISLDEFKLFGCPKCGFERAAQLNVHRKTGSRLKQCPYCELIFVVVPEGVTISPFIFDRVRPNLQKHPRYGHLKRVEPSGDFWPFFHFKSGGISFGRAKALALSVVTSWIWPRDWRPRLMIVRKGSS